MTTRRTSSTIARERYQTLRTQSTLPKGVFTSLQRCRSRHSLVVWTLALLFLLGASSLHAATYVVRPDGTGAFPNIQAAVNAAIDGDTIELTNGEYSGPGNQNLSILGKRITIRSQSNDPNLCAIVPDFFQDGMHLNGGETPQTEIHGVGFDGRNSILGRGVTLGGSSPSFFNCRFENHNTDDDNPADGRGVHMFQSQARFIDCSFLHNNAIGDPSGGRGGAIYAEQSAPEFLACNFIGNSAETGGAIALIASSGTSFADCNLLMNGSLLTLAGGAIYAEDSDFTLINSVLCNNVGRDGLVVLVRSSPMIEGCTFFEGVTEAGAVNLTDNSFATITRTLIVGGVGTTVAVYCDGTSSPAIECMNIYGFAVGNYVSCIAGELGGTNISEDPLFCDPSCWPVTDYSINDSSPCAPENTAPQCGLIGAHDAGCATSGMEDVATSSRLHVSAPNPFTESTTIRFDTPSVRGATVTIYDAQGRTVRTLSLQNHGRVVEADWDGTDDDGKQVSTGLYFVKMVDKSVRAEGRLIRLGR